MYAGTFPIITAEEAAAHIPDGAMVALSGFANAGTAKLVPRAIAKRAREFHDSGKPFKIRLITGSSSGKTSTKNLRKRRRYLACAISKRPDSAKPDKRRGSEYLDMHLSHAPQTLLAVFSASSILRYRSSGHYQRRQGLSHHFRWCFADLPQVRGPDIHRNKQLPFQAVAEMADITLLDPPPRINAIPIHDPLTRIGYPYAVVDPRKIVGIIETNEPDQVGPFAEPDWRSNRIADHVVRFLFGE